MSLPMGIIWKAKMSLHQKAGLAVMFSFGLVIIAVAILRAVEVTGKTYTDPVALAAWSVGESSICTFLSKPSQFTGLLANSTSNDSRLFTPVQNPPVFQVWHDEYLPLLDERIQSQFPRKVHSPPEPEHVPVSG